LSHPIRVSFNVIHLHRCSEGGGASIH
jgi:hypothetical protein